MSTAILRRELREHLVVLLLLAALDALAMLALVNSAEGDGGRFVALSRWTALLGVISAAVVAQRFIVRPYADRTEQFLETLPVSRASVMITRQVFGATFLASMHMTFWAACWLWQSSTQSIEVGDALGALVGMGTFLQAMWSWAALAAILGRYRYIAWFGLVLGVSAMIASGWFPESRLPLLGLVRDEAGLATTPPPFALLSQAAAFVALCHGAVLALAVARDGTVASALSRRMGTGERAAFSALLFVATIVVASMEDRKQKPLLALVDKSEATDGPIRVEVLEVPDVAVEAARALAGKVAAEARSLTEALGIPAPRALFLLPQRGIDGGRTARLDLPDHDGLAIATSTADAVSAAPAIRFKVLHEILNDATHGRASQEGRHWLLDGLATWWAVRGDASEGHQQWLRAAAIDEDPSPDDLQRWDGTWERLGACQAHALGFAVVHTIAELVGEEALLDVARRSFPHGPSGWAVWWREEDPTALLDEKGLTPATLTDRVREALIRQREAHEDALAARPSMVGRIAFGGRQGGQNTLTASLTTTADRPAWWVGYHALGPWTGALGEDLPRMDALGDSVTLPGAWLSGSRALVVIEADDPVLGCPVRVLSERVVIP